MSNINFTFLMSYLNSYQEITPFHMYKKILRLLTNFPWKSEKVFLTLFTFYNLVQFSSFFKIQYKNYFILM